MTITTQQNTFQMVLMVVLRKLLPVTELTHTELCTTLSLIAHLVSLQAFFDPLGGFNPLHVA